MALPELMARLERDAAARVAAVRSKARAEAERLIGAAREEAGRRRAAALDAHRKALRARLDLELAAARQQARAQVLDARRALLERVATRAADALRHADAPDALQAIAAEALRYVEGVPSRLICSPDTAGQVGPSVQAVPGVELVTDPQAAPGLVVEAKDGTVRIDARFDALLERAWPRLSVELLQEVER